MIYGIISYLRSLFILGFLVAVLFVVYIETLSKSYIEELSLLYLMLSLSSISITIVYVIYWQYILLPYSINLHSQFSHNTLIEIRNKRTLFLDFFVLKNNLKSKSVIEEIYTKGLKRFELELKPLKFLKMIEFIKSDFYEELFMKNESISYLKHYLMKD